MTTLSKPQLTLLQTAAQDAAGHTTAPTGAGGAKTAAALVKAGLTISVPQTDGPSVLLITDKGRKALPQEDQPDGPTGPETEIQEAPPPASEAPAKAAAGRPKGKLAALVELLKRDGATIEQMTMATGWQAHSVRGAISGSIKKALGLTVVSEKVDGVRTYRIPAVADQ